MAELVKKEVQGKVVKISGDKTISVLVERKVVHPKYRKIVKRFKKYAVHDEKNAAKVGDLVSVVSCRPISKTKSYRLYKILSLGVA